MEIRKSKIIKSSAGGKAARNAVTYKISLPTDWINKLGIDKDSREVEMHFDGKTITIGKKQTAESFISSHKKLGHRVKKYSLFDKDNLWTVIYAVSLTGHTEVLLIHIVERVKSIGLEESE